MKYIMECFIKFGLIAITLSHGSAHAERVPQATGVTVEACGEKTSRGYEYHYSIINNSSAKISSFKIGYNIIDKDPTSEAFIIEDDYQLTKPPKNWEGDTDLIPIESFEAPQGWQPRMYMEEESGDKFALSWDVRPIDGSNPLKENERLDGFTIVLSEPDQKYLTGIANIGFFDWKKNGSQENGITALVLKDTTPPTVKLSFNPSAITPADGRQVTVKANLDIKDDCDPKPEVRLIKINDSELGDYGNSSESTLGGTINTALNLTIANATLNTDDREFMLRALPTIPPTKSRVFSIYYRVSDIGNHITDVRGSIQVAPVLGTR